MSLSLFFIIIIKKQLFSSGIRIIDGGIKESKLYSFHQQTPVCLFFGLMLRLNDFNFNKLKFIISLKISCFLIINFIITI